MDESLFTRLANERPLRDAALTLGSTLMQPISAGQSTSGHVGDALLKSLGVLRTSEAGERSDQLNQQRMGLEERRTKVAEGGLMIEGERQKALEDYYQQQGDYQNKQLGQQRDEMKQRGEQFQQELGYKGEVLNLDKRRVRNEQVLGVMKLMDEWEKHDRAALEAGLMSPDEFNTKWMGSAYDNRFEAAMSLYDNEHARFVRPDKSTQIGIKEPPATGDEAYADILNGNPNIGPNSPEYQKIVGKISQMYPGWKPKAGDELQRDILATQEKEKTRQAQIRTQADWEERANALTRTFNSLATDQEILRAAQELTKLEDEGIKNNLRGNSSFENRLFNMKAMLQDKLLVQRSRAAMQGGGITRRPPPAAPAVPPGARGMTHGQQQ